MPPDIQLAAGSIVGRKHVGESGSLLIGRANQDAIGFRVTDKCLVATVHDGCGSGQYSEVGSRIGAEIVVDCIQSAVADGYLLPGQAEDQRARDWEIVRQRILARLHVMASRFVAQPNSYPTNIQLVPILKRYFQFTIVGCLMTPAETTVFSIGDGFFAVNGDLHQIFPCEGNKPPYVVYSLLNTEFDSRPELLKFRLHKTLPTDEVESVFLSTDGLEELIAHEERRLPGKTKVVGPVSQFWQDDRFFTDQFFDPETGALVESVTGFLRMVNSESAKLKQDGDTKRLVRELGLVQDDLTILSIRKKKEVAK